MNVRAIAKPEDAITLKSAASSFGKSVKTIRRWAKAGDIAYYQEGYARAPIFVSRTELHHYLLGKEKKKPSIEPVQTSGTDAWREKYVARLEEDLKDVTDQRNSLQLEAKTRDRELLDLREKVRALELEINGGVRGLLTGAIKKRFSL